MQLKNNAIVLRTVRYGDSRVIVDMLTRDHGRLSFVCHITKTGRGKVKMQYFQPLTILEIAMDYRSILQLQHFSDIRIARPFVSIPFDSRKLSICLFLSEFLIYATRNEREDKPLYDFVEKSLLWLDGAQQAFANFHLVFMMHVTLFVGFYPNLDGWRKGACFDLREGAFSMSKPHHPDFLNADDAAHIRNLMRMNYDNMHLFKMSRMERNRCTEVTLYYYRLHVPSFPELRSLDVLKTLF